MDEFAQFLFLFLVGLVVGQTILVGGFVLALPGIRRPLPSDEACPQAAVVLCLRGSDPFLSHCIDAILDQDYPRYKVHAVVDHPDDPAWRVVQESVAKRQATHISITALFQRRKTCSLKCSSLLQAVSELDPGVHFIAQLDADVIPHRTWLRELAGALDDERVGAATGNRWYMPNHLTLGSLVRYVWNVAAVVQMYWYGIAWGGTLAVKTSLFRETDLLERWQHAFCEDTMLFAVLRKHRLQVRFVPSLIMVNRESCDVGSFFYWVRRQLLTARLYHPGWFAVVGHAALTSIAPAIVVFLLAIACLRGEWGAVRTTVAGLLIYQLGIVLLLGWMEFAIRRVIASRHEPASWSSALGWAATLFAVPVTQVIYAWSIVSAMFLRRVDWRGIDYEIKGPGDIRLLEYRPYVAKTSEKEGRVSSL